MSKEILIEGRNLENNNTLVHDRLGFEIVDRAGKDE